MAFTINAAVNTLSHMLHVTARVSGRQKGQGKPMAGTREDCSETHWKYKVGFLKRLVLEVISAVVVARTGLR